jgi:DNA-binding transcriptional ArsR family regulator
VTTPKYNPAFLDPRERAQRFAGREHDLAELLRAVRENIPRDHNQHVLVLGSRGMGKTTLLLRAADVVRAEAPLASAWLPIVAPEELYQAGSLGEVWLEMVLQLAKATGDARHRKAYTTLKAERDNTRLAASALAHLLDFADSQHRRLLLVIENLHMLFHEQLEEKDAWAFREVLLHERRIMVLASAVAAFPGLRQPDAALYELFLLHPLEPLDLTGCMDLWRAVTGSAIPARRMRALEILTGGNPRLLTILADAAAQRSLPELILDLADLLDEHTDYLKMTTEALPALERKVFVSLAQLWEEATASQVAQEARLEVNVTSAQLARLESRGFVLSRRQGRGKLYRLAEGLYSLYHLMRRDGESAARARAAVAFMSFYYSQDPLNDDTSAMAAGADGAMVRFRSQCMREVWEAMVQPALCLASAGLGQGVLNALAESPQASRLEPLFVALSQYLGQETKAPELIEAIAADIVRDIQTAASSRAAVLP